MKASFAKYALRATTGAYKESHYRTVYFHKSGAEVEAAYRQYLTAIANAVDAFRKVRRVFVVLAATERLDSRACEWISQRLGGLPVCSSDDYNMYELVSILRACNIMVSSRYHGIVTSMPGLVASAGITMDERIRNLMRERQHGDLLLEVDDPQLEGKLMVVLDKLWKERERIAEGIGRTVVKNLQVMARMGVYFEECVQRRYPDFPVRGGVRSWEEYLPPFSPGLEKLAEEYEAVSA